jgi:hypothetical protein
VCRIGGGPIAPVTALPIGQERFPEKKEKIVILNCKFIVYFFLIFFSGLSMS